MIFEMRDWPIHRGLKMEKIVFAQFTGMIVPSKAKINLFWIFLFAAQDLSGPRWY